MTNPDMRASDVDRQQAADRLAEHHAAGRLTINEYDERLAKAYAAVHLSDLPPLFADLPGEEAGSARPSDRAGAGTGFGDPGEYFRFDRVGAAARDAADSIRGTVQRGPHGKPHPAMIALAVIGGLLLIGGLVHVLLHVFFPLLVIAGIVLLISRRRNHRGAPRHDWGPSHAGRPTA